MKTDKIQIGKAVLYCGDCRTIIKELSFDSIVTDPPYGLAKLINKKWEHMDTSLYSKKNKNLHHGGTWAANPIYKDMDWDNESPDLTFLLERNVPTIIFGGNYFSLPPSRKWIVWNKGEHLYRRTFAECELCYCSFDGNVRMIKCAPESIGFGKYKKDHPTQKPVAVMQFCISELPKESGNVICDPYMGSGTTGAACVNMGRAFIGIEQNEKYFDIACRRIKQACADYKNQFPEVQHMIERKELFE